MKLKYRPYITLIFFIVFLIIGIFIFRDYGVHIDEYNNQSFGSKILTYIESVPKEGITELSLGERGSHLFIHGPVFEVTLKIIEKVLKLSDVRDILLMRHLAIFLAFYAGAIIMYMAGSYITGNWKWGLLASVFFILHPAIFAHAFFNSVDIPFLVLYAASVFTLIRFLDNVTVGRASAHAIVTALSMGIRLASAFIPVCTILAVSFYIYLNRGDQSYIRKILRCLAVYLILLALLVILFYPQCWHNPLKTLLDMFDDSMFYKVSGRDARPWFYYPLWILITTPPLYSFFFVWGVLTRLKKSTTLIFLFAIFAPIILAVILKTRPYDAWRHFFFVYPPFVLLSITGAQSLWDATGIMRKKILRLAAGALFLISLFVSISITSIFMVRYHPVQYLYCNIFTAHLASFIAPDMTGYDYWRMACKPAIESILKYDKSEKVGIYNAGCYPFAFFGNILPKKDRKRIQFIPCDIFRGTSDVTKIKYAMFIPWNKDIRWFQFTRPDGKKQTLMLSKKLYSLTYRGKTIIAVYTVRGFET